MFGCEDEQITQFASLLSLAMLKLYMVIYLSASRSYVLYLIFHN